MKIQITQKHKSINPPYEFELPAFSVLTGKNGSGKTHLLEAISMKEKSEVTIEDKVIQNIRYIPFNSLNPTIREICDPSTITEHVKTVWNQYNSAKQQAVKKNNTDPNYLIQRVGDENAKLFVKKTFKDSRKAFNELTEDDLADSFDISFMGQNDFFTAEFALIFKEYHRRQEENNINKYYQSQGESTAKIVLAKQGFKDKFGDPPWEFVNRILLETNIPYEVNSPIGTRKDSNFILKLKDRKEGWEISSADLSTGEKILMSLALAIYNAGGDLGKPDILLIDEPDAGLHPSMSRMMVGVLKKNIVEDNNIPTIITTHSPTTVIASEGISVYQLERGNNLPSRISVQAAVELLSSDIPFLRISTDKRRQVFVESKYDVQYYELITNILTRLEALPSEPVFIPARTSDGSNCTDVIEIVRSLSSNGNEQIYGVIDWDTTNNAADKVLVLGENERYAIENYLLDPFLMGLLFIRGRHVNIEDFGTSSFNTYAEANQLTVGDAQLMINKILNDLGLSSDNLVKYRLYNGWELSISTEYTNYNGHELEALYKEKYPFLKTYTRESQLKKDVIEKVINDYPQYTPVELFDVVKRIK